MINNDKTTTNMDGKHKNKIPFCILPVFFNICNWIYWLNVPWNKSLSVISINSKSQLFFLLIHDRFPIWHLLEPVTPCLLKINSTRLQHRPIFLDNDIITQLILSGYISTAMLKQNLLGLKQFPTLSANKSRMSTGMVCALIFLTVIYMCVGTTHAFSAYWSGFSDRRRLPSAFYLRKGSMSFTHFL